MSRLTPGQAASISEMKKGCGRFIRHYLTPAGAFADMPRPARFLAEYFASIVVDATIGLDDALRVRCLRRPGRRRCVGVIVCFPSGDAADSIDWYCAVCNDHGSIRGWQGTLWDGCVESEREQFF